MPWSHWNRRAASCSRRRFCHSCPGRRVVTDRVRAILDLDKRLMAQSIEARDRVAAELGRSSKGRKATQAYHLAGS